MDGPPGPPSVDGLPLQPLPAAGDPPALFKTTICTQQFDGPDHKVAMAKADEVKVTIVHLDACDLKATPAAPVPHESAEGATPAASSTGKGAVQVDVAGDAKQGQAHEKPASFRQRCRFLTTALCSLFLGTAGLGGALRLYFDNMSSWTEVEWLEDVGIALQITFAIVAMVPGCLFLVKVALHPGQVVTDLVDPRPTAAPAALISAGAMALAPIARAIYEVCEPLGLGIWYGGYVLHLALTVNFTYQRVSQWHTWKWSHCTPAWFVVYVGVCVFAANSGGMHELWQPAIHFSLYLGIFWLVIVLPFVTYRLVRHEKMEPSVFPSLGVYMAPSSLCTAGWLTVFPDSGFGIVLSLLVAMDLFTAIVSISRYRYVFVTLPVYPARAGYTFPTVIFAVAVMRSLRELPNGAADHPVSVILASLAVFNCTVVVLFVNACFVYMCERGDLVAPYTGVPVKRRPLYQAFFRGGSPEEKKGPEPQMTAQGA